jgi:hypothetical protein
MIYTWNPKITPWGFFRPNNSLQFFERGKSASAMYTEDCTTIGRSKIKGLPKKSGGKIIGDPHRQNTRITGLLQR